jgi:site-specific DNA recombinase
MNFAFYGQATTTDRPGARTIHTRQLADATTPVQAHDGRIVAEYFDVYPDRLTALRHRRRARHLLHAIEDGQRRFDAIVIGDSRTALTAMQYDGLLWLCTQHGLQLWLPEIDQPVDPDSDVHQ